MIDRTMFDALKVNLAFALAESAGGSHFPVAAAVVAVRAQTNERHVALVSLGASEAKTPERNALEVADLLSVAAAAGIRSLGRAGGDEPVEALVDLLGHAEAVRALWYDLFLGIKKGTAGTEHMFLTDSAKQLVAEAGACAAFMSSDASQLFEFAKESGLLASPA